MRSPSAPRMGRRSVFWKVIPLRLLHGAKHVRSPEKLLKEGNPPQQTVITPQVGILTLHFQLYACDDLKAKRKVFTALKAVWGKEPDLAVAETADHEALDCATWTIAALGGSSRQISERLDQVEKAIEERVDAAILDIHREIL